ncbi:MAG: hypothetical protein R3A78_10365 [Polyangiales bacterium]
MTNRAPRAPGSKAFAILEAAGADRAILDLKPFHLTQSTLLGKPVTVARTGYTAEDGVEVFSAWNDAGAIWDGLRKAGEAHGLAPAGLGARDTLRLEGRLSLYGNEIDETTNPLEAGLGWVVKLDKGDFVGRAALRTDQGKGRGSAAWSASK